MIVTVFSRLTELVASVTDFDVAPAGIVTVAGTVTMPALLLVSETVMPAAGAGALIVTVASNGNPPTMLVRDSVRDASAGPVTGGGLTVNVVVFCTPL